MAKIKSLIYREWVLTKRTLFLGLVAAVPMLMLGVTVGNGFRNGSFDGNERMHTMLAQTGYVPYVFMVAFFLIVVTQNGAAIYQSDIKANWTRYSMTLPTDTKCRAFAHTLFLLLRIIAAFLISLFAGAAITAAFGKPFRAALAADIGLWICISLLEVCAEEFFRGRAKDMIAYKKQTTSRFHGNVRTADRKIYRIQKRGAAVYYSRFYRIDCSDLFDRKAKSRQFKTCIRGHDECREQYTRNWYRTVFSFCAGFSCRHLSISP